VTVADRIDTVIEDATLRRLARSASDDTTAPVLIEVDVPTSQDVVAVARAGSPSFGVPGVVAVERTTGRPTSAATRAVSRVLGRTPQYVGAARAYAAVATGSQLAALAATPAVRAIRPNRLLRVS
jgi:hypothetical protein